MKLPVYRENISVDHCVFNRTHVYHLQRAEPHKDVWLSTPRFSPDGPGARGTLLHERGRFVDRELRALNFRSTRAANPGEPPSLGIWSQHGRDKNDTSDLRYHDAVDGTFTQMEELTIQMSRFVIRSLTKIGQNPPPNGNDINKHNRIRTRSRKEGTNPCKGEAKPPPKVSPPGHPPPFFPPCDAKVHKGIRLGRAEGLREDPQKGTSQPYESKSKVLDDVISDRKSAKDRQGTDRPKTSPQKLGRPTKPSV